MKRLPRLCINLNKIRKNTETITTLAKQSGIEIIGVTKATCGNPHVGRAMLKGGVKSLADSRISNIKRLKESLPAVSYLLLRSPMLSQIPSVIKFANSSINTELMIIKALAKEAEKQKKKHHILLMAELGERREGMNKNELRESINVISAHESLSLLGIGMNLTCFSGVIPTEDKIKEFLCLVEDIEQECSIHFNKISAGNTANIPRLFHHPDQTRINQLRVGEGILLGRETIHRSAIKNTFQDAFVLEAELIEVKWKPSIPDGELTENAFGEKPVFEDKGEILRGIAAIGLQDVLIDDLVPCDKKITILGGSSDHLILELPDDKYLVGDRVRFIPKYGALVHLFTSKYVHKTFETKERNDAVII